MRFPIALSHLLGIPWRKPAAARVEPVAKLPAPPAPAAAPLPVAAARRLVTGGAAAPPSSATMVVMPTVAAAAGPDAMARARAILSHSLAPQCLPLALSLAFDSRATVDEAVGVMTSFVGTVTHAAARPRRPTLDERMAALTAEENPSPRPGGELSGDGPDATAASILAAADRVRGAA